MSRIDAEPTLRAAYEASGRHLMHLQKAVEPHDLFVRTIALGPQVRTVLYDPSAPLHDRYTMVKRVVDDSDASLLADMTLTINSFFGWDFNSCESLRGEDGVWHPIDFANPCPDSQVTSLHYHFPWLVMANLRWALFCAATSRRKRPNLDWAPYFDIAATDAPYREKLRAYAGLAHRTYETDAFEDFCATHLAHLDEVAHEFFGSDAAKDAVRRKVQALYPVHEVESFTELFWERLAKWRAEEGREERGATLPPRPAVTKAKPAGRKAAGKAPAGEPRKTKSTGRTAKTRTGTKA